MLGAKFIVEVIFPENNMRVFFVCSCCGFKAQRLKTVLLQAAEWENGLRKDFTINVPEWYVGGLGFKIATLVSAVGCTDDWAVGAK